MRRALILSLMLCVCMAVGAARKVTVRAVDRPAPEVFRSIVEQTGKNFVYSSELLRDMRVSVDVADKPLRQALDEMFRGTDIEYRIKGKNIILRRRPAAKPVSRAEQTAPVVAVPDSLAEEPEMLEEVVVVSRLEAPAVETAEIGARKLSAAEIVNTPVMFGESDVIKALQMQPGITQGAEGMAGMHVHGGNADENLFMLDNVPLYQVNHFGGLFSAFNVDAIRYIDFFKSSIPAKYDGRLSSYLDARTRNGMPERHHGSFKLGLTSGAFFLEGPIRRKTSYMVALRRSWFDVLTAPALAIYNSRSSTYEKVRLGYAFTDLNAKLIHRFNSSTTAFVSVYFGHDYLKSGTKDVDDGVSVGWFMDETFNLKWGNVVAQAGVNHRFRPTLSAEFTGAYTRYFSGYTHDCDIADNTGDEVYRTSSYDRMDNHIDDWIVRGDFDWRPSDAMRVRFGGAFTLHSFLPARTQRRYDDGSTVVATRDSTRAYTAGEANVYIEDDWRVSDRVRVNAGFHGSLFTIDGKTHAGLGPRLSVSYRPRDNWAVKAAYSRTTQYVHQLCRTYLSLPTDQWVPITGKFKPQTADKVSAGGYWQTPDGMYTLSAEAYYKYMRNLVDYRDEYYLQPPMEMWDASLCSGHGTAKGVDFKAEKMSGKFTGHIAYSLGWTDRTFAGKNGGHTFPARFDHRHTINVMLNWNVSDRVSLNAAWTGHSGSRFTLLTQVWEAPDFESVGYYDDTPLQARINNYQLPFYHRLDLSVTVRNRRGCWNFSIYNAYCHMNTVAIRRAYTREGTPVFQRVRLLPVIPSVSYTWQF